MSVIARIREIVGDWPNVQIDTRIDHARGTGFIGITWDIPNLQPDLEDE